MSSLQSKLTSQLASASGIAVGMLLLTGCGTSNESLSAAPEESIAATAPSAPEESLATTAPSMPLPEAEVICPNTQPELSPTDTLPAMTPEELRQSITYDFPSFDDLATLAGHADAVVVGAVTEVGQPFIRTVWSINGTSPMFEPSVPLKVKVDKVLHGTVKVGEVITVYKIGVEGSSIGPSDVQTVFFLVLLQDGSCAYISFGGDSGEFIVGGEGLEPRGAPSVANTLIAGLTVDEFAAKIAAVRANPPPVEPPVTYLVPPTTTPVGG